MVFVKSFGEPFFYGVEPDFPHVPDDDVGAMKLQFQLVVFPSNAQNQTEVSVQARLHPGNRILHDDGPIIIHAQVVTGRGENIRLRFSFQIELSGNHSIYPRLEKL